MGACEGVIAGLVGITPAAGYVSIWPAAAIGFITSVSCSLVGDVAAYMGIDDGLEVFKLHGIGGMIGSFLTGILADQSISLLDGVSMAPGGANGNGIQVAKQLAEIAAIGSYSFTVSAILLFVMNKIPGLQLRVSHEVELAGVDSDQFYDEVIGEWDFDGVVEHSEIRGVSQTPPAASVVDPAEVSEKA